MSGSEQSTIRLCDDIPPVSILYLEVARKKWCMIEMKEYNGYY